MSTALSDIEKKKAGRPSDAAKREAILVAASDSFFDRGFAATSIDQLIQKVGMTKGTFFYHFKTKNDLARALIDRFARADGEMLASTAERASKLSDDPLQQLLIFVGLMIEVVEDLDNAERPGCLFATYCYESGLFEDEIKEIIRLAILKWRTALVEKLEAQGIMRLGA